MKELFVEPLQFNNYVKEITMHYVIQENLFKESHYETLIEYLERYGLSYETVPFRPFTGELQFKTDRKDVWFFGSVNGANVIKQYDWYPGSMSNDNHDFEVYAGKYGMDNMLNGDGTIQMISEPLPEDLPYFFFARPAKDTKTFSGGLFNHETWADWIKDLDDSNLMQDVLAETKVLVASLKDNIQQEIRCWIVGGKVVTMSQYKLGTKVKYQNMDDNFAAREYAQSMADIYCPAEAFVLDICMSNDDYKIVEINGINCSGFYDGDMSKLLQALEAHFN